LKKLRKVGVKLDINGEDRLYLGEGNEYREEFVEE